MPGGRGAWTLTSPPAAGWVLAGQAAGESSWSQHVGQENTWPGLLLTCGSAHPSLWLVLTLVGDEPVVGQPVSPAPQCREGVRCGGWLRPRVHVTDQERKQHLQRPKPRLQSPFPLPSQPPLPGRATIGPLQEAERAWGLTAQPGLQPLSPTGGPQSPRSIPQDQVHQAHWRVCCGRGGASWSCLLAPGAKGQ